ncbi:hypothetical protein [Streptomyces yanii]|uniref:Uncharacterized protein n=1 Tax=Streptomyces yanii TaxID=78510 RepID=A0ABV5RN58_9ACTN
MRSCPDAAHRPTRPDPASTDGPGSDGAHGGAGLALTSSITCASAPPQQPFTTIGEDLAVRQVLASRCETTVPRT